VTRTALRLLAATVAACVALLLGAAPAFAHTRLESSNPTDKSSVDAAPESVSLTFNEDISAEFATMSVVGPDGTNYQSGQVSAAGGQVSTAVSPLGPAGVYQIGYRVVSDDGHPVRKRLQRCRAAAVADDGAGLRSDATTRQEFGDEHARRASQLRHARGGGDDDRAPERTQAFDDHRP